MSAEERALSDLSRHGYCDKGLVAVDSLKKRPTRSERSNPTVTNVKSPGEPFSTPAAGERRRREHRCRIRRATAASHHGGRAIHRARLFGRSENGGRQDGSRRNGHQRIVREQIHRTVTEEGLARAGPFF